ncbi:hypothetical protein ACLMJK_002777 [Lecanora helva]
MINSTFSVTIGVEFELILAFHETLLHQHLTSTNNPATIIKSIPPSTRHNLSQVHENYQRERPQYMGWALTSRAAVAYESERRSGILSLKDQFSKYGYRGYAGEVLTLAQSILRPQQDVAVHDTLVKRTKFGTWYLTQDNSLVGVGKEVLGKELSAEGREGEEVERWDNHPVELVSRVLPFTRESLDEIETYLALLRGGETQQQLQHMAFATEACGFHVHVGLPTPTPTPGEEEPLPTFSLPTLQHLAYILVMYEKPMRALFPSWRREGSKNAELDLMSNLESFLPEEELGEWDDEVDNFETLNARREEDDETISEEDNDDEKPTCPTVSFAEARKMIFAPSTTLESLAELMGGTRKSRLVNWTYLLRHNLPRTIEFRQHEGTLDGEDVRCWINFVVGVVRLAEERGRVEGVGEGYDGRGYRWREWDERISVGDLVEMCGLGEEGERWVERRVGMWK